MDRKIPGEHKQKRLTAGLCLVLFIIGTLGVPYALSVEEPGRILLLGAALIAVAIWGRRWLARQQHS
jgi:hypothetical protein